MLFSSFKWLFLFSGPSWGNWRKRKFSVHFWCHQRYAGKHYGHAAFKIIFFPTQVHPCGNLMDSQMRIPSGFLRNVPEHAGAHRHPDPPGASYFPHGGTWLQLLCCNTPEPPSCFCQVVTIQFFQGFSALALQTFGACWSFVRGLACELQDVKQHLWPLPVRSQKQPPPTHYLRHHLMSPGKEVVPVEKHLLICN